MASLDQIGNALIIGWASKYMRLAVIVSNPPMPLDPVPLRGFALDPALRTSRPRKVRKAVDELWKDLSSATFAQTLKYLKDPAESCN